MFQNIKQIIENVLAEEEKIEKGQKAAKRRARIALSELSKEAKSLRALLNQKEGEE